ncbi:Hypothetical predicted protein, partial [Mytilus galloprovincialis]
MKMLLQTFISVLCFGVGVITIVVNGLDSIYCQEPADIGFLVDASGSVNSNDFEKAKRFIINFTKEFSISNRAVQISVFAFNDEVEGGFYLNSYSTEEEISSAILGIVFTGGNTDFDIPLNFARTQMFVPQNGARSYVKKILIFITDGDADITDEPGQLLRDIGVTVYTIGVGENVNTNNLDKIATSVNHRYIALNFSLIDDLGQNLTSQACIEIREYMKDHPCQTNPDRCNFGLCWPTGNTSYRCDCDFGYTGEHCESDNCEPSAADIVFVIDVSASLSSNLLNLLNHAKDHAELATKEWKIDNDHFQIALVTVAESASTVLGFSHIATKWAFLTGISNLNLKNEPSNIHLGLYKAVELLTTKGRSNVKKKIILYSDGLPSNPSALEQTLSYSQYYSYIDIYTVAIGIDVSHYFLAKISRVVSNVFPYNSDALWHCIMQNLIKPECNACVKSEQADVIILVDLSGIQHDYLNSIVPTLLVKILSKIRLGTNAVKLALVTFCDQASTRFNFNAYSENNRLDLQRSLSSYEAVTDKSSNILEAIKLAEALLGNPTEGARSSAKKVILVISEFKNSLNEQDLRYAEELRNNGINIHTIGIFADGNAFDTMSGLASTLYHIVCQDPADIGFLLDASGSVVSSEFEKVKTFAINFIKKFDISNQAVKISAFAFDAEVKGGFHFNHFSTEQDISTGIRGIVYTGGGTSFDIPLTFAREQMFLPQNGARGYTKKILIFITDGDAPTTDEPGQLLRDMGVAVYAIGVGSNLNTNNLDKIATSVNHRYMVLSFSLINKIKDTLTSKACKDICEPVAVDVVFVIDVSASMDSKFLNHAKDHTELTTKEWQIDDYHFQIALVTVAKSANTVLGFSNIATKDDLRNGIANINLKNEPSNIHLGLSKAFELFNIKGRSNVKKKIILYSDGLPSNPPALERTLSSLQHYSNIEIYTVALGVDVSHYFLSRISRDVSNVFPYNTDALWHHIMQDLIKPECN